ncbi:antimicrobial peptide NK-lysin [Sparus aurata]|uniref:Antimicrobial peptide NK-lysin-like n=1 Tax=Sparus aurata TaxID=8175 RepID=A0A671TWK0_SPAAU|nr:antimicrobial peptide NK-lysin-like [Sparus aurata]
MGPAISIALLLLSATVVRSLVVQTEEEEDFPLQSQHGVKNAAIPGLCKGCVWIVSAVKKRLGSDHSKEKIRQLLDKACNWLKSKVLRSGCQRVMRKFRDKLINAIEGLDSPRNICVKLKACKRRVYR